MDSDRCSCRIVHEDKVELARRLALQAGSAQAMSNLFKACSDPGRLRLLHALMHQEMCVCDLAALLGVSESSVSHQLRLLRTLGLVANRREGVVLYYRLVPDKLAQLFSVAAEISGSTHTGIPKVAAL
jgi:ArsR family transcriptional regulator, lead/cadmium/zinc/bismuth-responsive transcriptional repressor